MAKEAYDDYQRWKRDIEANGQKFQRLTPQGSFEIIQSSEIRVGDFIKLDKNERVRAWFY
jgi:phospholipid-translocating ATPase